jgi:hypothetical protein
MDKPLNLILVDYSHVPYGAKDEEFEHIYACKLKPFITTLNKRPAVRGVLHYSGILLSWLEHTHPEVFMLIKDLISREQVELIGGGFYEPMMPLISQQDKIGQIELFTDYLRKNFKKRPLGCWLPILAWEPGMVEVLNRCGLSYTFLPVEQFQKAGLEGEALFAPCLTEEQGKLITVFPLFRVPASGVLSCAVPGAGSFLAGATPDTLFQELKKLAASADAASGQSRIIAIYSNGILNESFGIEDAGGNIPRLFRELSRCENFASFTTPGRILKNRTPSRKAYFAADSKACIKRFLINYPEANGIYAKTIYTHILVNQLRGDKARKTAALKDIWKAQSYDTFCRGWSGGLYRGAIRNAAYKALLTAEKDSRINGIFTPALVTFDIDFDGEEEYIFRENHISVYVKRQGAAVFELDFMPRSWNYLDTLLPHETIPRVPGTDPGPAERRMAFTDILAFPGFSSADFVKAGFSTQSAEKAGRLRFCGGEVYEVSGINSTRQKADFHLNAAASPVSALHAIEISKTCQLKKDHFLVRYNLTNRGKEKAVFDFVPRIDLAFPGAGDKYLRIYRAGPETRDALFGGEGELAAAETVELHDLESELIISLTCDKPFDAHFAPVYASCLVYGKEQRSYQSTCVLPVTRISLESGASWPAEYTLKLSPQPRMQE